MALATALLFMALVCFSAAFAPDCNDLVKPIMPQDPTQVFGKWIYVVGAGDPKPYHNALSSVKSSWIQLYPTSNDGLLTLRWADNCFNRCIYGEVNATVAGLTTIFRKNLSEHKGHILQTCTDCLLWTDTFVNGDVTGRYILLFTRTGGIDLKEVERFREQAVCLNFHESHHSFDGTTGLCPDNKETPE